MASAFPSEIVQDFLYLGSYDNASRSELLKAIGMRYILNVSCLLVTIPKSSCNSATFQR